MLLAILTICSCEASYIKEWQPVGCAGSLLLYIACYRVFICLFQGSRLWTHEFVESDLVTFSWSCRFTLFATFFFWWEKGVLLCDFARNRSLIKIVEHPKFGLWLPQALNYGCATLDNSGEQITADSASAVYMIGKSSNTLCYIGDGKLPVWGLLVKGVKRWGIFQRLGAKRQVDSGLWSGGKEWTGR